MRADAPIVAGNDRCREKPRKAIEDTTRRGKIFEKAELEGKFQKDAQAAANKVTFRIVLKDEPWRAIDETTATKTPICWARKLFLFRARCSLMERSVSGLNSVVVIRNVSIADQDGMRTVRIRTSLSITVDTTRFRSLSKER
jgi:hypothetical protein